MTDPCTRAMLLDALDDLTARAREARHVLYAALVWVVALAVILGTGAAT